MRRDILASVESLESWGYKANKAAMELKASLWVFCAIFFLVDSHAYARLIGSKKSFGFFVQGDPGERGLSGPLGSFGPKVRPLPVLSYMYC